MEPKPRVRIILAIDAEDRGTTANDLRIESLRHRAGMLGMTVRRAEMVPIDEPEGSSPVSP